MIVIVFVYLDDILIFSLHEHHHHVHQILQTTKIYFIIKVDVSSVGGGVILSQCYIHVPSSPTA